MNTEYGDFRSLLTQPKLNHYAIMHGLKSLENPDLRESALISYLSTLARRQGEDPRTVEFSAEVEEGRKTVWKHGNLEEMVKALRGHMGVFWKVKVNPTLKAGMEISSYINGDSYGCIITKVDSQKQIWVANLRFATVAMAKGVALERIAATCYTRRQKRNSGKRGWVTKGSSINAMRYSGLTFNGAVDRLDPHF